jgi:hypothetical protein
MSDQRSIEMSIVRTLSASTRGQPPSHRRIRLTVMVLGVVALCIAWRIYWHGSGAAKPLAEGPAESIVTIERGASPPRSLGTRGERTPEPSARPALGHASAGAEQPQAAPNQSSAPGDEPVTEAPSDDAATELPILQALTEQPKATREQIRAVAEGALANPSPDVRTRAQRILTRWMSSNGWTVSRARSSTPCNTVSPPVLF